MYSIFTVALLGAAQGLMLLLSILSIDYGNRRANRILAAFIAVISLRLFLISLEYQSSVVGHDYDVLFVLLHLSYALGPLLFFYVRLLVEPNWQLRRQQLWHFVPVLIAALVLLPGGPVIDIDTSQYASFDNLPAYLQSRIALASTPVFISLVIYSVLALRVIRPYQLAIKEQFSALESINLNWLKVLVWFCLVIAAMSFVTELYRAISGGGLGPRAAYSVIFSVLLIYYIGLMGLRQPLIFDQGERSRSSAAVSSVAETATESDPVEAKYQKSGLGDDKINQLWDKLGQLMAEQEPYLQPGIKLAELARLVNTRPNYLSQAINSRAGQSFYDYINHHRIERAKTLLLAQPDAAVSEIAMATGFNSQNVFNGHFKKQLGLTPTQYRKRAVTIAPG